MPETETTLTDGATQRYAEPEDVERYVRNMDFNADSEPDRNAVEDILSEVSDEADNMTNRAWRVRRCDNYEARINPSYNQEKGRRRTRERFGRNHYRSVRLTGERAVINLPHTQIKTPDSAEGDEVVVLEPRSENDITDERGRDSAYTVDERRGLIRVRIDYLTKTAQTSTNFLDLDDNQRVRVSYRFGRDSEIPGGIKRATAKLAAAELIETDAYGEILPGGTDNTPDQTTAAERLRTSARSTLTNYRYVNRV